MSSKLMGAATLTDCVPWRTSSDDSNSPAIPTAFLASSPGLGEREVGIESHVLGRHGEGVQADHLECDARINLLKREIEQLRCQASAEKLVAYQQGLDAGIAQELNKWTESIARVSRSLADLASVKPKLRFEVEGDAVRLSLAIARKVLRRECTVDPEALAGLVRVALEKANARDVLRIRTAPQDAQDLSTRLASTGLPSHVEVVADSGLERGSVLLDTNQGHVDASVETQLQEIERGLADALDRNRHA